MNFEKNILNAKNIHFIGIGGSGMFPIVQIFLEKGYSIQGSDNNDGDTIELEKKMGAKITIGHDAQNIVGADLIIYSAAINKENPELIAAEKLGIPAFERSEVLGYLTKQYDDCICIAGTHGKTSATSMATHMLIKSKLDPTAIIGGKLPLIGGNGCSGSTSIMTCEACEYVNTFLKLYPDIAVILNIDADHLEFFGSIENIIKSFRKFAELATKCIIINGDDANSMKCIEGINKRIITFGFGPHNDYIATNIIKLSPTKSKFDLVKNGELLTTLTISVPGRHNIYNALAACVSCLEVGATPQQLEESLESFTGAGRRFEVLGNVNGITIADDYAHHPAEIKATLEVAMEMGYNKVWAVFQPFTYSRTSMLLNDFASSLSIADNVVMSEIMGAREQNTYNIYTKDLAEKIDGSRWFKTFEEIADYVMSNAKSGDLVLTMGCGDIYKCAKMMCKINN